MEMSVGLSGGKPGPKDRGTETNQATTPTYPDVICTQRAALLGPQSLPWEPVQWANERVFPIFQRCLLRPYNLQKAPPLPLPRHFKASEGNVVRFRRCHEAV